MNEVQNFNINHILEIVEYGLDFDSDLMCFELIDKHTGYSVSGTNNIAFDRKLATETWSAVAGDLEKIDLKKSLSAT